MDGGMINSNDVTTLTPLEQALVANARILWKQAAAAQTNRDHFEARVALAIKDELRVDPAIAPPDASAPVDRRGEETDPAKIRAVPLGRTHTGKYAALVIQKAEPNGLVEGDGHEHPLGTLQVILEGTGISALIDEKVQPLKLVRIPYMPGSQISNENLVAHAFKPDANPRGERVVAFLAITNDLLAKEGNVRPPSPGAQAMFAKLAA